MKKVYKLGDFYFSINNISLMTKPEFTSSISKTMKDEYAETGSKEVKSMTIWVNDKRYCFKNYWDSGYNIGITEKTENYYNECVEEADMLFKAFIEL